MLRGPTGWVCFTDVTRQVEGSYNGMLYKILYDGRDFRVDSVNSRIDKLLMG